jgi:hypothetical protein
MTCSKGLFRSLVQSISSVISDNAKSVHDDNTDDLEVRAPWWIAYVGDGTSTSTEYMLGLSYPKVS